MSEHIEDHERIEELMAGRALRALSPEDAALADRLLAEHVPTCERCRATLQDFTDLGGDLALAARPVEPPDLLLPRLRQSTGAWEAPVLPRRRPILGWTAAVAAAVVVGLVSWNTIVLEHRVSKEDRRTKGITAALTVFTDPHSKTAPLNTSRVVERPRRPQLLAAYVPGRQEMSIFGTGVPGPTPGRTYRLWLVHPSGSTTLVGDFHPDEGLVALYFYVDLAGYSGLLISEESGQAGSRPAGETRWATRL